MRLRIWDLPTRVFHALLALCTAGLVITGQLASEYLRWHFVLGQVVLSLLVFRLIWGVVGGHWSRFKQCLPRPAAAWRYVRAPHGLPGHNPLGALSVWAMLGLLLLQCATGLVSDDEIASTGPFTALAPAAWVSRASAWHTSLGLYATLGAVCLHVLAVIFYKVVRQRDLISAMVHGDQFHPEPHPESIDTPASRLKGLVVVLLCGGLVFGLVATFGV